VGASSLMDCAVTGLIAKLVKPEATSSYKPNNQAISASPFRRTRACGSELWARSCGSSPITRVFRARRLGIKFS